MDGNHLNKEPNVNKKRKISIDYGHNEEKNVNDDNSKGNKKHLIVHRLILVEFSNAICYFRGKDLSNYLRTCKDINKFSESAWKSWRRNAGPRHTSMSGVVSKMVNLSNEKNNCFMNVCFQALHHIALLFPNFRPSIRDTNKQYENQCVRILNKIMDALDSDGYFETLQEAKIATNKMRKLLAQNDIQFGDGLQHDASAFLGWVIHTFYDTHMVEGQTIPIIVGGRDRYQIVCAAAGHVISNDIRPFFILYVPIFADDRKNIQYLLNKHFMGQIICPFNGKCSICNDEFGLLYNGSKLYNLPAVLILQLEKIFEPVHLNPIISVPSFDKYHNMFLTEYHLFAFIVHAGDYRIGGHYYIYCKCDPRDIYKCFNDQDKDKIVKNKIPLANLQKLPQDHSPVAIFYKKGKRINNVVEETKEEQQEEEEEEKSTITDIMNNPIKWCNLSVETIECFGYPAYNKTFIDDAIKWNKNAKICVSTKGILKTRKLGNPLYGKKNITIQQETGLIIIVDSIFIYILDDNGIYNRFMHHLDLDNALVRVRSTPSCIYIGDMRQGRIMKFVMTNNGYEICCVLYDRKKRMAISDFSIYGKYIINIEAHYVMIYEEDANKLKFKQTLIYPRTDKFSDINDEIQVFNIIDDFIDERLLHKEKIDKTYLLIQSLSEQLLKTKHYPKLTESNKNWLFLKHLNTLAAIHPLVNKIHIFDQQHNVTMFAISEKYGVFAIIDNKFLVQYVAYGEDPHIIFNVNSEFINSLFAEAVIEFEFILYDETYGISGQLVVFVRTKSNNNLYFKLFNFEEYESVKHLIECVIQSSSIVDEILSNLYNI